MKNILLLFFVLFATTAFAQDSTKIKVEAPKIVNKLKFGEMVSFNNIKVKLVKLISDSRCPKGVNCIWAGEVVILVDIFEDEKKIETKKMTFNSLEKTNTLYVSKSLSIYGVNISPYPVKGEKIALPDYKMHLYVKN